MNEHTEPQIITSLDGTPQYVVVPYDDWIADRNRKSGSIPQEVVDFVFDNDWSAIRGWREYLGLTQVAVAERMGISQSGLARIEQSKNPRKATLSRAARALSITLEQLDW